MKIPQEELHFSVLSPDHDLSGFICCEKDLEEFLKEDALVSQNNRISVRGCCPTLTHRHPVKYFF